MTAKRSGAAAGAGARAFLAGSLALAALVLAVFLPALGNGHVWDDREYVLENPGVAGGVGAAGLRWALTTFHAGNWHPLTWLSHQLDADLFGDDPAGPHAVNVLLHLGAALALFAALRLATGEGAWSLLAAALFAVHPLRVESVAWIAERKDVLSVLFGLLAVLAHCAHARRPGTIRYAGVLLCAAASLLAKQTFVTLPALLLLLDAWPLGRLRASSWRRPLLEKLPLAALAALAGLAVVRAQASAGALGDYPAGARLANAAVAAVRYVLLTLAPADLAVFYPHPRQSLPLWVAVGAALALGAATVAAVRGRRARPWLATGWLWHLVALAPVIGVIQVGEQASADRYTYLPAVGLAIAAVWGLGTLARRDPALRPPAAAAALAAVAAFSLMSWRQLGHWRDDEALFTHAAAAVPGNWVADFQLGALAQRAGRHDEALARYRAALAARPGLSEALNNAGTVLELRGARAEAARWYREAVAADPGNAAARGNLERLGGAAP